MGDWTQPEVVADAVALFGALGTWMGRSMSQRRKLRPRAVNDAATTGGPVPGAAWPHLIARDVTAINCAGGIYLGEGVRADIAGYEARGLKGPAIYVEGKRGR